MNSRKRSVLPRKMVMNQFYFFRLIMRKNLVSFGIISYSHNMLFHFVTAFEYTKTYLVGYFNAYVQNHL